MYTYLASWFALASFVSYIYFQYLWCSFFWYCHFPWAGDMSFILVVTLSCSSVAQYCWRGALHQWYTRCWLACTCGACCCVILLLTPQIHKYVHANPMYFLFCFVLMPGFGCMCILCCQVALIWVALGPASAWSIIGVPIEVNRVSDALPLPFLLDISGGNQASFVGRIFPWIYLGCFSLQVATTLGSYPGVAISTLWSICNYCC